ncbi:MAG: TIGR01777 family oxidoreductase [Verrucomicrobia bacterium]|nr:TIGR01777 family oxidoreductase [Verrucomicrobiota bacterium]
MNILITGASGFVGSAVANALGQQGHNVLPLARGMRQADRAWWDPNTNAIDLAPAGRIDAALHLAGENIAGRRWTATHKARILASRADTTRILARALAEVTPRPTVLVSASAIGYYGDRGNVLLDEQASAGIGFLPDVCRAWESAAAPAVGAGIRVVHARIGVVLDPAGGALAKMLPMFRLGLGGRVGSGGQWMSWITLPDLVNVLTRALTDASLSGPINCVAPTPVTNKQFTQALGRALHRPTAIPLPASVARLMLGEMADGLLLASARVVPRRLQASRHIFQQPALEPALRAMLA